MSIGDIVAIKSYSQNDHTHIGLIIDVSGKSSLVLWAESNRPTTWWRHEWLEVYNADG